MIEFTRPIPMKKTCTMHPENKSVRSVSFTDDNDHTTTVTLCSLCLAELEFKASETLRKHVEERSINGEGLSSEEIFQGAAKPEFQIGDYVFLSISQTVSRIKSLKQVEAANQMKFIRPATGKEIEEYIETKNKKEIERYGR